MKKILMNAAIATGFALFAGNAFAADAGASVTSIGFESTPQGQLDVSLDDQGGGVTTYWNDDGDDESTIVTNYTDTAVTPPKSRPDLFAGDEYNNIFLKIDSPNGIERYMTADGANGSVSLDNDYFVDMNVQFTVSDTVLDLGENTDNDKLAIWLYAPDTENATTNLVITAAELDEDKEPTLKNFVVGGVDIQPDTWYRLTVRAVGEDGFPPKFNVYIDGDEDKLEAVATLAADGTKTSLGSAVSDFYSLVKYAVAEPTTKTLSSVTFQGVGALDDLAFTTTKPGFIPAEVKPFAIEDKEEYATLADAIDAAEDGDVITMKANYDVANEDGGVFITGNVTLDLGEFTLSSSIAGGDTLDVAGSLTLLGTGTVTGYGYDEEAEDTYYPIFIEENGVVILGSTVATPTVATIKTDGVYTIKRYGEPGANAITVYDAEGAAITGTWEAEAGETGYYVFTPGGEEPAGDLDPASGKTEVTVNAGTAAAAEAAAKAAIKVPAAAAEAVTANAYAEYFTYSTVDNGNGTFTVAIEGIVEQIEEAVLESAVERLTDDEATTITVPAGLYYSITPSTALPISGEAVKGLSTGGTVSVDKPGTTAGFYEIKISPTEIK